MEITTVCDSWPIMSHSRSMMAVLLSAHHEPFSGSAPPLTSSLGSAIRTSQPIRTFSIYSYSQLPFRHGVPNPQRRFLRQRRALHGFSSHHYPQDQTSRYSFLPALKKHIGPHAHKAPKRDQQPQYQTTAVSASFNGWRSSEKYKH